MSIKDNIICCKLCFYWFSDGKAGWCHRYPPNITNRESLHRHVLFPYIGENSWCGEFSAKDEIEIKVSKKPKTELSGTPPSSDED